MRIWEKSLICKRCDDLQSKTMACSECAERCCDHTLVVVKVIVYSEAETEYLCFECVSKAEMIDDR